MIDKSKLKRPVNTRSAFESSFIDPWQSTRLSFQICNYL